MRCFRSQETGGSPVVHGIYQWSGKEAFTKYQMAVLMGKVFNLNTDHLEPCHAESPTTPRPHDVRMDTSRLDSLGLMFHTPFAEGIEAALQPFAVGTAAEQKST
jgi:dTDP-4-dehydrorhamnose reductase